MVGHPIPVEDEESARAQLVVPGPSGVGRVDGDSVGSVAVALAAHAAGPVVVVATPLRQLSPQRRRCSGPATRHRRRARSPSRPTTATAKTVRDHLLRRVGWASDQYGSGPLDRAVRSPSLAAVAMVLGVPARAVHGPTVPCRSWRFLSAERCRGGSIASLRGDGTGPWTLFGPFRRRHADDVPGVGVGPAGEEHPMKAVGIMTGPVVTLRPRTPVPAAMVDP